MVAGWMALGWHALDWCRGDAGMVRCSMRVCAALVSAIRQVSYNLLHIKLNHLAGCVSNHYTRIQARIAYGAHPDMELEMDIKQIEADVVIIGTNDMIPIVHVSCQWECNMDHAALLQLAATLGVEWNESDGEGTVRVEIIDHRTQ